jgi:hypothetical protein
MLFAATLVPPYIDAVETLEEQIETFLTWNAGVGAGKWKSSNTLFSIWVLYALII